MGAVVLPINGAVVLLIVAAVVLVVAHFITDGEW